MSYAAWLQILVGLLDSRSNLIISDRYNIIDIEHDQFGQIQVWYLAFSLRLQEKNWNLLEIENKWNS
jgi:hypothetical protein